MAVLLLTLVSFSPASANPLRRYVRLDRVNSQIGGRVLDFTRNHGSDNRIWSPSLCQKRDLYVYLPPGFDPCKQYPLMVWLHGYAEDEFTFLRDVIEPLDQAMRRGCLPPAIIAAPDGSISGLDCFVSSSSFFLNSEAGRFEDFLMCDIWNFVMSRFPIRPETEAHAILGVSLGGSAAFNKAIKFPGYFKHTVGIFPALNLRWQDCHGRYQSDFDPNCWGWRTDVKHRHKIVAHFYGVIPVPIGAILNPLYSRRNPDTLPAIIRNNPIEMLDIYNVQPGQVEMYAGYGSRDEFNIGAHVESFAYAARQRGLEITVGYVPDGKHNKRTAEKLLPGIISWLAPRLAPYAPGAILIPDTLPVNDAAQMRSDPKPAAKNP
jgi:S-formylglutathione hydrolase FrmB